jgi:hypothetical protein
MTASFSRLLPPSTEAILSVQSPVKRPHRPCGPQLLEITKDSVNFLRLPRESMHSTTRFGELSNEEWANHRGLQKRKVLGQANRERCSLGQSN